MPNGFSEELKKWQKQIESSWAAIQSSEAELGKLGKPTPIWQKIVSGFQKTYFPMYPLWAARALISREKEPRFYPPLPYEVRKEEETAQQVQQYQNELTNYNRAAWFTLLYSATPGDLAKAGISNFDTYIEKHPPEAGTPNADLVMAKEYIDTILTPTAPTAPATYTEALAEGFITEPLETRPRFKGIHMTTVEEMTKWLKQEVPPPELPPGLAQGQLLDYLKEERGLTDEELAEIDATVSEWIPKMEEFEAGREQIARYKAGLETPEMPEMTFGERAKMIALQPALALMDAMQPYWTYWNYPVAATITRGATVFPTFPGAEHMAVELDQLYKANREAGMGYWMAHSKAWQDWDLNNWAKMGIEMVTDPVSYIGFGILIKAAKLTRGVPVIGKIMGGLGSFEKGFITTTEAPFTWLKSQLVKFPKTIGRRAVLAGVETTDNITAVQGRVASGLGKKLSQITPDDFVKLNEEAIAHTLANPDAINPLTQLGWSYVKRMPITHDDLLEWAIKVGSKLTPDDITPGMVAQLDNVIEHTTIKGSKFHVGNLDLAAKRILGILEAIDSNENIRIIRGLIKATYDDAIDNALKVARMPIKESIRIAAGRAEKIVMLEGAEKIYFRRLHQGYIAGIMNDILDPLKTQVWRNGIDKHLVMPFARAYLLTGSYAPWNWGEEVFRTIFGRGGFIYGKNAPARLENLAVGLMFDRNVTMGAELAKLTYGRILKQRLLKPGATLGVGELSAAALLRETENAVGKPALEKLLLLGWLPGGKGRAIHEALYFPIRASNWAGGMQRAGYTARKFLDNLDEMAPDAMKAIRGAKPPTFPTVPGASKRAQKAFLRTCDDNSLIGPARVENTWREFSVKNTSLAEAHDASLKYAELGNTRDYILSRVEADTWSDIPAVMKDAKVMLADELINSPEGSVIFLEHITDDLLKGNLPIKTTEELRAFVEALREISDITPKTIQKLFVGLHAKGAATPSYIARAEVYDAGYRSIAPFLDAGEKQAGRLLEYINRNMANVLSPDQMAELTKSLNIYMARITAIQNTRRAAMARSQELIASGTRAGSPKYYDEMQLVWDNYFNTIDPELFAQQVVMAEGFDNLISPANIPKPIINASVRGLTPADVAALHYGTGDNLAYALMNSEAMMQKPYFVSITKKRAEAMAARANTTREALGFTDDAIGQVYDQVIYGLRSDPKFHNALTKQYGELDNFARDLESIRLANSASPDMLRAMQDYSKTFADDLRKLDIYKPTAKPRGRPPKKPPVKLPGEGSADWWKIKQDAMDKTMISYHQDFTDYTNSNALDDAMKHIFPYWCVPEDVKILTRHGYVTYDKLVIGEDVLVADPVTLVTRWEPLQDIAVFDFDDELMVIPAKGKDIKFTPNHRWLIINAWSDRPKIKRGYELKEVSDLIPRALPHEFPEYGILEPRDAAILGWACTDGYINRSGTRKPRIIIYQNIDKYLVEIQELCGTIGTPRRPTGYTPDGDWNNFVIRVKQEDTDRVLSFCPDWSYLPELVTMLDREAAEVMWDAMFKAEGNVSSGTMTWKQNPGPIQQAFVILSILLGKAITIKDSRINILNNTKPYNAKQARRMRMEHYSGKVWCPVTPSGTWFADFNGSVIPTGNTYESQRWFWLPRSFVTHPGTLNAWAKYMDNTDFGYIHIPGTSIDFNLFRGTVYKGGMSTLVRRDYPEYYDRAFPELFETMDYAQRWGFFPNVFWSLLVTEMGGRQPQRGQILPAVIRTPLDLFVAANPGSEAATALQDILFPDYFRQYLQINQASHMASDDQVQRGITGVYIWEKIQRHDELTPEEQELWDAARGKVASYSPLLEHGGIYRLRHEDRTKAYELWGEFLEEKTGVSIKMQKTIREHGMSIGDVVPGLSQLDMAQIEEALEYQRWIAPRATAPLRPSGEIEVNLILSEFWGMVRQHSDASEASILELEKQAFVERSISAEDYVAKVRSILEDNANYIHDLREDTYNPATGKWETNPASKSKFRIVPVTLEERATFYAERGVNLSMSTLDEMLAMWYDISPREVIDPETGIREMNWGVYFATMDTIEQLLPDELRSEWQSYMRRNTTPAWLMYRNATKQYLAPYWNVTNVIKKQFTEDEQSLINEYYMVRDIDPTRAQEIEDMVRPSGLKLVSQYRSAIANARKKLRMTVPMIDAQLMFWGRTTTLLTPEAERLYNSLVDEARNISYAT